MVVFLVLMGFLAFSSGYLVSLEDRFQRDGQFCPFSLRTNLKASPKARKVLTWLGMLIWLGAAACYVFDLQDGFQIKHSSTDVFFESLALGLMIYGFMYWGYGRELEFKKTGSSANSQAYQEVIESHEWPQIASRAAWAVAKILIFLALLYVLRWVVNG